MVLKGWRFWILLAVLSFTLIGCRSKTTEDIVFRLTWSGPVDLDLHVKEPNGMHLCFSEPESISGGILDIDCNGDPDNLCDNPAENVLWPNGNTPSGKHQYWVELFQSYGAAERVEFTLQVLSGKTVLKTRSGTLTLDKRTARPYKFLYAAEDGNL
jgi:hypothetical protein